VVWVVVTEIEWEKKAQILYRRGIAYLDEFIPTKLTPCGHVAWA